jgi:hypothetical protein
VGESMSHHIFRPVSFTDSMRRASSSTVCGSETTRATCGPAAGAFIAEGVGRELGPVAALECARARRRGHSEGNEFRVNYPRRSKAVDTFW